MRGRLGVAAAVVAMGAVAIFSSAAEATGPTTTASIPQSNWLSQINYYRQAAGLAAVTEDAHAGAAATEYARYLVFSGSDGSERQENPQSPAYSVAGDAVARGYDLVNVDPGELTTDQEFVESWVTDPYTQIGLLDPTVTSVGYGRFTGAGHSRWASAVALDMVRPELARSKFPVTFPANGANVPLGAMPADPEGSVTASCPGYAIPTGLPITIQFPAATTISSYELSTGGKPLDACLITAATYKSSGNAVAADAAAATLRAANASVIVPRSPLTTGSTYQVSVTANGHPLQWSFTEALPAPIPTTTLPLAPPPSAAASTPAPAHTRHTSNRKNAVEGVLAAAAIAAFLVGRGGVGPKRRRNARAVLALAAGVWVATAVDHRAPLIDSHPNGIGWLALIVAGVLAVGLVITRLLRMARGTWKPKPGAFDVVPLAKKW